VTSSSPVYNGSMTFLPPTGDQVFRNQIVHCVITYTSADSDENIPSDAIEIELDFNNAVKPDVNTVVQDGRNFKLSLSKIPNKNPPQYQGDFYTYTPLHAAGGPTVGYDIGLTGYNGASTVDWALRTTSASISYFLDTPTVPVNSADDLTAADPQAHKVVLKAIVTDGAGAPAQGYPVFWSGNNDQDIFKRVNAFAGDDKTVPAPTASSQFSPASPVIRGATDHNGVAMLTLVPKTDGNCIAMRCFGEPLSPDPMNMIAVYDADNVDFSYIEPSLNLQSINGRYNLDSSVSDFVTISIGTGPFQPDQSYDLFVLMNGQNVAYQAVYFPGDEDKPVEMSVLLAKALFHSDSDAEDDGDLLNEIFYIVNSQQGGCVTSLHLADFHCVGSPGEFKPDMSIQPRDLPRPVVENAAQVVNNNTIQNGLKLQIPVNPVDEWTPQVDDLIVAKIYLHGWNLSTAHEIGNVLPLNYRVAQKDIDNTWAVINFPSTYLYGYANNPRGEGQATFYAEYYVVKNGEKDQAQYRMYSDYVLLNLNTV